MPTVNSIRNSDDSSEVSAGVDPVESEAGTAAVAEGLASEEASALVDNSVSETCPATDGKDSTNISEDVPKGWPRGPKTVRSSALEATWDYTVDLVFALLSLLFLVFAITVKQYDQTPTVGHEDLTNALLQASNLGPTIFPILFAAIVGRALKGILTWRLERGERLGLLDLLAGSTTLVNTITTQFAVRMFTLIGLLLFVVWSLSPVGGQASLRVVSVGNSTTTTTISLEHLMLNRTFYAYDTAADEVQVAAVDAFVTASLLSPWSIKTSSMDTWQNVKIPMIESIADYESPDEHGWYTVPKEENIEYSSLIGIPITSLSAGHDTDFSMETSYWSLECPVLASEPLPPKWNASKPSWIGATSSSATMASNDTSRFIEGFEQFCSNNTLVDCDNAFYPAPGTFEDVPARTFIYNAWDPWNFTQSGANCSIRTVYVEAAVHCIDTVCATSKLRHSTLPHSTSAWTFLDSDGGTAWRTFARIFVNLFQSNPAYGTPVQAYFVDPKHPFKKNVHQKLSSLDKEVYATRLAQLMNTVWIAAAGLYAISGGIESSSSTSNFKLLDASDTYKAAVINIPGVRSTSTEVIQCNLPWFIALCICSLIMLVASLVHPVIRSRYQRAPNFVLTFSTMAKDQRHVHMPYGGSSLDSYERARLLKDVKVRFGDVAPKDEHGYLALGSLESGEAVARIRKDRLYA